MERRTEEPGRRRRPFYTPRRGGWVPRLRAAWRTGFAELEVCVDGRDFPAMADCSRSTALMVNLASLPSFCWYEANA